MTSAASDEPGLPAELAGALRTGPFALALDLAIRHRGLSMEAVQRRMAARGASISLATLSYWRRGRRHPDGDRSRHAVRTVEDCLGLPRDALTRLVEPQRHRGRPVATLAGSVSLASALGAEPTALGACDGIDLDGNARMAIASVHERSWMTADRTERAVTTEMVVVSKADGVDRWVSFFRPQRGGAHLPTLTSTSCCRPGRIRTDPDSELLAVELRFDYPLRAGETYVFGFEYGYAGALPATDYFQYGIRTPARELMLQVSFDQDAVPVRCYRYHQPRGEPDSARESELPIGPSMTSHIAVLDAQPGVYGIVWEWD